MTWPPTNRLAKRTTYVLWTIVVVMWITSTKTGVPTPFPQTEAPKIPKAEIFTTNSLP